MPLFAGLSSQEKVDLLHHIDNKSVGEWNTLENLMSKDFEKKLAKIQEKESYLLKNRYRLDNETMRFADKKRMPVD